MKIFMLSLIAVSVLFLSPQVLAAGPDLPVDCKQGSVKGVLQACGGISSIKMMGAQPVNKNLQRMLIELSDLKNLKFEGVDMSQSLIRGTKISDSQFNSTNFSNVVFAGVRFDKVDFNKSNFKGASFIRCYFRDVNFKDANIEPSQFVDPIFVP